jgi:anthranilate phosphoribosyltransferase
MNFIEVLEKISDRNNLTREEASFALRSVISGELPESQIAAFLFGMRSKGETIDELTAFVNVMRQASVNVNVDVEGAVDMCGTGGDHSGTFNISTASMFVVAGAGVPVLKHGNRSISSKSGSYDVLEKLGVVPSLEATLVEKCFAETKMAFMFAPLFHPAMKHVMPARKSLGMRTFFNILGPLLNPAGVKRQVIGAYNREVASLMIRILTNLDTEYAFTLHAHDGLDELSTTDLTDLFELKNSVSSEVIRFDPTELGYRRVSMTQLQGGDAMTNADIIRSILKGTSTDEQREIVELNATFSIFVSGKASSIKEAKELAVDSIISGNALKTLDLFAQCTQDLSGTTP